MAYPGSFDTFTTKNAGDTIAQGHVNDLQTAVVSLEHKLGSSSTGLAASTNTALLGAGASASGFQIISLANSALVQGVLTAARGGTGVTNTNTAGGAVIISATGELPAVSGSNLTLSQENMGFDSGVTGAIANNTATFVPFNFTFASVPVIVATPGTHVATNTAQWDVYNRSTTGFTIYQNNVSSSARVMFWIAIGTKA